jgi:arylsulfatase A-like enzyme
MRCFLWLLCSCLGLLAAPTRPNILFILTDDQGYGDLSAHGNPVLKTPNLDRLRAASARLTDFHVSPTCAPTRSALLTGRHEFRNGVTHTIFERERLTLQATTLPQVLQSAGYRTGIFGKWHLGDEAAYQPGRRGFDEVFIHGAGGIGQTYVGSCGDAPGNTYFNPAILHNGKFEKTQGFCTDVFFAQATKWIEGEVAAKRPFYCHLATNAPHAPYTAKPEDAALYADKAPNAQVAGFYGMIHNIDQNVGRLLARLEELGVANDTLVVFMNDNGTAAGQGVFNAGMRGAKGTAFLGGTRAMAFWRWPGKVAVRDVDTLAANIDFLPTVLDLVGVPPPEALRPQVEGRSLAPFMREGPVSIRWPYRTLVTHVGRWERGAAPETGKYSGCSVRTERWQLVSRLAAGAKPAAVAQGPRWMLFDVKADPGEQTDVAANHPEVVKELSAYFEKWWTDVQPSLVNEKVVGPSENPFKVLYREQMGK